MAVMRRRATGAPVIGGDFESKRRLEVIVEVVSSRFGLPVFIYERGITAAWYEKGKVCLSRAHLNELLKDAPDKCVKACVYHEAGHAMLSDLDVMLAFVSDEGLKGICASESEKEALRMIYNYLEDIRIEHAVASKYEGVEAELHYLMERVHGTNPEMNKKSGINQVLSAVYLKARYPSLVDKYVKKEVLPLLEEFASFGERVKKLPDSKAVFLVSCDMLKELRARFCPPDPPPPPPTPPSKGGGKKSGKSDESDSGGEGEEEGEEGEGSSKGKSSKKEKGTKEPKGGKKGDAEDSDGAGDEEDGSREDSGDSGSEGTATRGSGDVGEDGGSSDTEALPDGPGWDKDALKRDLGLNPEESPEEDECGGCGHGELPKLEEEEEAGEFRGSVEKKDYDAIRKELAKEVGKKRAAKFLEGEKTMTVTVPPEFLAEFDAEDLYPVMSTVEDKVVPYYSASVRMYDATAVALRSASTTLVRKLKDLFILDKKGRHQGGFTEGQKVDVAVLTRAVCGDPRVFMKRFKESTTDTAITLLVDLSGSMSGHKVQQARESAIVLCEVLNALKVPFEVLGFSTQGATEGSGWRGYSTPAEDEARYNNLRHWVFKAFDQMLDKSAKQRIGAMTSHEENWDGEAILWAYTRLKKFPAKNRFLWVLSDGQPAGYNSFRKNASFTKAAIRAVEKKVDVIGIGYGSNHVERFYKQSVYVRNISDLSVEFVKLMRRCLL